MKSDPAFVSGLELSHRLAEHLEPILRRAFPAMPLTLALIGPGSDVLGFDTPRSRDHDWGPRLSLLVPEDQVEMVRTALNADLSRSLPDDILGYSTRFSRHADGTALVDATGEEHRVRVTSVAAVIRETLLVESLEAMDDAVWLSTPMQKLVEVTSGEVFVDDDGDLTAIRSALAFYPDHIWRYQLAGLWMRVAQVQPFIGRCFENDDVPGAITIAMGIVRDFMRIGLLQSRQYAPYSKWLGTAFARTEIGKLTQPELCRAVTNSADFPILERELNAVGSALITQLNDLHLIGSIDSQASQFWSRPYLVLPAEEIAFALKATLAGTGLERFEAILGGIDVITDSTDAINSHEFRRAVKTMFSL